MSVVCHAHFVVMRWRADLLSSPHGHSAPLAEDFPCPMNSFGTFVDRQLPTCISVNHLPVPYCHGYVSGGVDHGVDSVVCLLDGVDCVF